MSKFDRAWLFSSFQTKKIIESRKTVHNNDDNEKAWESRAKLSTKANVLSLVALCKLSGIIMMHTSKQDVLPFNVDATMN